MTNLFTRFRFYLFISLFIFSALFYVTPSYAQTTDAIPGEIIVKYRNEQTPEDLKNNVRQREERKRNSFIGTIQNTIENLNYQRLGEKLPEEKLKDVTDADKKAKVQETETLVPKADAQAEKAGIDDIKLIKTDGSTSVDQLVKMYEALPEVEYAEPNIKGELFSHTTPNDPGFSSSWGLNMIGAKGAWDTTRGSRSVTVAVIDTGVNYDHEDLSDNIWVNPREIPNNNIDDDKNGYKDDVIGWDFGYSSNNPYDSEGHGSHVAGIIGAVGNNGKGVTGVNWTVKIMPLQVFDYNRGQNSTSAWAVSQALYYAYENGAKVVNMSLGFNKPCNDLDVKLVRDMLGFSQLYGVTVVVAAGNGDGSGGIDASTTSPASCNNVITVGAVGPGPVRAPYSNYGGYVDISAPGGTCTNSLSCTINSTILGNNYGNMIGTSMASPYVAGVAALMLAQNPSLSPSQVESILKETATNFSYSDKPIGGIVNAERAVFAVANPTATPTPTPPNSPTPTPVLEGRITFSSLPSSKTDVYTINANATNQQKLNNQTPTTNNREINLSRDGSHVVYVEYNGISQSNDLIFADFSGGSRKKVPLPFARNIENPLLAPNNQTIIFSSMDEKYIRRIHRIDMDGTNFLTLIDNSSLSTDVRLYDIASDGSKMLYGSSGELYTADLTGNNQQNVSNTPNQYEQGGAAFSPSGNEIIYTTGDQYSDLTIKNLSTGATHNVIGTTGYKNPSFSPDGSLIIAEGDKIYTMTPYGVNKKAIVAGNIHGHPWAPLVTQLPATPTPTIGDMNGDSSITILDFELWRTVFTGQALDSRADVNKDNKVDILDFNIWRSAFTQ